MEGQLVDDDQSRTLLGVSTLSAAVDAAEPTGDEEAPAAGGSKVRESYAAGQLLAERALEAGVTEVVFDRAGYRFQGRVKAFAEGARAGGLRF
jgi:large subunit ribosomal protein L18